MSGVASPASDEDEDDGFEVSAITSSDGKRLMPAAPAPTAADLLGVSAYGNSDSDSDGSASDVVADEEGGNDSKNSKGTSFPSENINGARPAKRDTELQDEPPSKRKRVQFALDEGDVALRKETVVDPILATVSAEEEAELEATLAAFEAEVGPVDDDLEERDMDLAEAEDAREEALQKELKIRVQQMRARLKGENVGAKPAVRLNLGGEEIRLKVRKTNTEKQSNTEEDASESEGEIDLMRDWTQFTG